MNAIDTAAPPAATICLYGTRDTGAGWLVDIHHVQGTIGDGRTDPSRSFTEAVRQGIDALLGTGLGPDRTVRVFAPGGQQHADVALGEFRYYGDLEWEAVRP